MTYQIKSYIYEVETCGQAVIYDTTFYETKALAHYIAYKTNKFAYDDFTSVVEANNIPYIKKTQEELSYRDGDEYYGSPTHALLGDAWLYRDCPEAW